MASSDAWPGASIPPGVRPLVGQGIVNNRTSAVRFERPWAGVPAHDLATFSEREMRRRRLDPIEIDTIVRTVVAGSLARRTALEEGMATKRPAAEDDRR